MDGPLAMVWAPYHFYYNGTLLHCGVDSFQLIRTGGVWKILYIVDTRKKGFATSVFSAGIFYSPWDC